MTTLVLDIKEKSNMQRIFFHLLHLKFGKIALMHMVYLLLFSNIFITINSIILIHV